MSRLISVCEKVLKLDYEIIFCADPCTDDSIIKILKYREINSNIKLLLMSRRFGQPADTIAGLSNSMGESVVIMDADLQDPPEIIPELIKEYNLGFDVVHAKRIKRLGESKIRLAITHIGYKLINILSNTKIPRNVGDFKILSRRVVNEILLLKEANI
jgi:dolichol-phosphate mannosyltransferase